MSEPQRVSQAALQSFIYNCLVAEDIPPDDAAVVSRLMAEADVNGSDGHGVFRLAQYIERIQAGGMNRRPQLTVVSERAAMALVDGDNGLGHLAVNRAVEIAMEKAATTGVAWAGTRMSNHAGPAGLYARMPLRKDMIGIYMAVGNANHLPPWGGTDMLLSTNPIAVAVPTKSETPIVLDMATTVAAYGKVKTKAQRGEPMPEGWMIDRMGQPLTDPQRADEGFLLPIGGPKGYGLALIFGLLAGTLNGAAFGKAVIDFNADSKSTTNTGQMIIAVSVEAFCDVDAFKEAVDQVIVDIRSSPTLPGFDSIRLPGERAHSVRLDNEARGIPVHGALLEKLHVLADSLGVERLL
ncbi:MAG: Ldh family oxidoreductase [Rhodospirillales bacterium]|nr:Ldh family oxidoreductase [Rhodospirillales bacterium]